MATQKPRTKEQRRARRHVPARSKSEAERELVAMLDALKRDALQFFFVGKFTAKKKLSNGATVKFEFTMPALDAAPEKGGA